MTAVLIVFLTLVSLVQTVLLFTIVAMLRCGDSVTLVAERVVGYALRTHLHDVVDRLVRHEEADEAVKNAGEILFTRDRGQVQ